MHTITVMPLERVLLAADGENLLTLLRREGYIQDAPCGGQGSCGKCRVLVDGAEELACRTEINRDMTVTLLAASVHRVLTDANVGNNTMCSAGNGWGLAVDIGTTTLAACLMNRATGEELCSLGMLNPQSAYGADVISRIRHAQSGHAASLTDAVRCGLNSIIEKLCSSSGISPDQIETVSVVGNPAMQQLFLGIPTDNLTRIPFVPVLTQAETVPAVPYLPVCSNALMHVVPNISAYIGADTVGCILATQMDRDDTLTLLVDIGTNGEMVLGNSGRLLACSTAAGPALEGANIRFGMRGREGAIDHVRYSDSAFLCSVIGGGEAEGICGSGLIDAVAAALDAGLLNERGRILNAARQIHITERVCLTQEDIREVQLAKGAIAAGIEILAERFGVAVGAIERVYLAGAFGTYMDPVSGCRIGLLPSSLAGKIRAVGNAALGGAKLLACDNLLLERTQELADRTECISLAEMPEFTRCYAKNMRF